MAKKKKQQDDEEVADLITQTEAAELRKVSIHVIGNWIRRGHIRGFERFGKTLVSRSEVVKYIPSKGGRPKTHTGN